MGLVQMNSVLGDLSGNLDKVRVFLDKGWSFGADILCFPEMSLNGYLMEDKVFDIDFVTRVHVGLEELAQEIAVDKTVLIGALKRREGEFIEGWNGKVGHSPRVYNAVYMLSGGKIRHVWTKQSLPNYDVFDEKRHFVEGEAKGPAMVGDVRVGVLVCEDCWYPDNAELLGEAGSDIIVCCNASPYTRGKEVYRHQSVLECVVRGEVPIAYVNLVGGQDELVFDGGSFVVERGGGIVARMPHLQESIGVINWESNDEDEMVYRDSRIEFDIGQRLSVRLGFLGDCEGMYSSCVLALRDFVEKNDFGGIVIGLSGGIDSALSTAIAVDAIGCDRVLALRMPSRYTSRLSMEASEDMRLRLGFSMRDRNIDGAFDCLSALLDWREGEDLGFARENLQSRIRGLILMGESNVSGWMLLSTGNKSELGVGYATIYGDMCGAYSVLKDLYKRDVYRLAEWRNLNCLPGYLGVDGEVIPTEIIARAPSAELREDQKDEDTLPCYDVLDVILESLIDEGKSVEQVVDLGYSFDEVVRVREMIRSSEHKRYQSTLGVKLSARAFGKGWRYPVTDGDKH